MKKTLCLILALAMVLSLAACGSADKGPQTYTVTHSNVEEAIPDTPFTNCETGAGMNSGYASCFVNFVDSIEVVETLTVDGENYTYVWEAKCGTESDENPTGIYWGTFTYTGTVASSDENGVTINAPTYATFALHSTKSFATNAEMIGYFGIDGTETTSETTECAYPQIVYGQDLLNMLPAGTFSVSGDAIGSFTAA